MNIAMASLACLLMAMTALSDQHEGGVGSFMMGVLLLLLSGVLALVANLRFL